MLKENLLVTGNTDTARALSDLFTVTVWYDPLDPTSAGIMKAPNAGTAFRQTNGYILHNLQNLGYEVGQSAMGMQGRLARSGLSSVPSRMPCFLG